MACHGLGIFNVQQQYLQLEDADENVEGDLEPLRIPRSHHDFDGVKYFQTPPR